MTAATRRRIAGWRNRLEHAVGARGACWVAILYPAGWCLYHLATGGFGPRPVVGLIYWSGIWATLLLVATLWVTPLARIFGWRRLSRIRRMIGVAALAYTLAHVLIYFGLYQWRFAVIGTDVVTRPTLIAASIAAVGLVALGVTSFDAAVRRLGRNWKRLQSTNYVLTGLAVVHFLLSPGIFTLQYVFLGAYLWAMFWRGLDRLGDARSSGALALLSVATALACFCLELVWLRSYHSVPPTATLSAALGAYRRSGRSWASGSS